MSDIRDADRDNEVERIRWAFKLNPLEQLDLRFDVDIPKEVPRYGGWDVLPCFVWLWLGTASGT